MKTVTRIGTSLLILCWVLATPTLQQNAPLAIAQASPELDIDPSLLPPEMGQTDLTVFVDATEHMVSGMMLDYWRANGSASVYGNPISEPFVGTNGLYSQAFERGVFQYSPEWVWTDDPTVRLQPIGQLMATVHHDTERADGRRRGGDRRLDAWRPVAESEVRAAEVVSAAGRIDEETGFGISGPILEWFDAHEGRFYLGAPISEPHAARGVTVQAFQGGTLALTPDGTVAIQPLSPAIFDRLGIDNTPVAQKDVPSFDEGLFTPKFSQYGIGVAHLTGRRWIIVDVDRQTLTAYQGDRVVLETLVSTGLSPNDTEIGEFHVRIKREKQDMSGFTDSTGEVITTSGQLADGEEPPPGERYEVTGVPDVMYINFDAEAMHGAYWHDNFGNRMSHGCINLPIDVSGFLFDWAPLGTAVTVIGPQPNRDPQQ